ncbi:MULTISPECIES: glycerate kinase [unclassified Corynebacterium]|uniref:glycerate kinase n=1 Tax=unclassified Corynebacterium TaxID=2624378 RepID=UPI0021683955|nr:MULTISPECIES: glycerate kinase [unclassified Corynebacterium]MCS4490873.1 glycerate kinase [Corynebacterium sp. ES2715-CONJ3]MCS4531244.1 glycerate kinase [Corynebacterium sp. ES2730-CONJ]
MRIVIAPDSFKGSGSATEIAAMLAHSIQTELLHHMAPEEIDIVQCPMADGGEGTSEVFTGERITLPSIDANGRLIEASYTFDSEIHTAYIDLAQASGLPLVADDPRPLDADTFGTGVLIADAHARGATRIVLGLGGTATTDAGTGILAALGVVPVDTHGRPVAHGGGSLSSIDRLDTATLNIGAAQLEWILLRDVSNPATGPNGTARQFAPQKGATPAEQDILERGITDFASLVDLDPQTVGFGAAGALPLGLIWLSRLIYGSSDHIHLLPGAKVVADSLDLMHLSHEADWIITGEGQFDSQSEAGKVVLEVLDTASHSPARTIVVAGKIEGTPQADWTYTLIDAPLPEQLRDAGKKIAHEILRTLQEDPRK